MTTKTQADVDDALHRSVENGYDPAYLARHLGVEQLVIDLLDKDADFEGESVDDIQPLVQAWLDKRAPHG
jgi:hypothetical protein